MVKKEDYQVATLWPKNFEELDVKIDDYILVLISDLATIIPKNYDKFFSKMQKKPYIKEKLRQIILSKYHNDFDI